MLRKRKEKDFPSNNNMIMENSTSNRKRTQKLPLLVAILLCLVVAVAYYTFAISAGAMDTNNGLQAHVMNNNAKSHEDNSNVNSDIYNGNDNTFITKQQKTIQQQKKMGNGGKEGGVQENSNAKDISDLKNEADKDTQTGAKTDCKSFDHGDTSPEAGVDSIFNCNSEYGKCK